MLGMTDHVTPARTVTLPATKQVHCHSDGNESNPAAICATVATAMATPNEESGRAGDH